MFCIGLFVIGFLVFTVYPLFSSLYYSLTKYDGLSAPEWIGLKNYTRMFTTDIRYQKSLLITFIYVFTSGAASFDFRSDCGNAV